MNDPVAGDSSPELGEASEKPDWRSDQVPDSVKFLWQFAYLRRERPKTANPGSVKLH